ncbi:MAG: MBL fold metallo-hydrolase [Clostridia bacterium]|nr:MBL fold metallo-hydrolase [Clostridia bacterium]
MEIIPIISRDYRSNTLLAVSGKNCAIIDPGLEKNVIKDAIDKNGLYPSSIVLTHGHFDHIFSLDLMRDEYNIPVYVHAEDNEMLTSSEKNAFSFFFGSRFEQKAADYTFVDGDKIKIGDEFLTVIHTPGHSKGSSCFMCDNILVTGDTLFAAGIGRTDLHGGDPQTIFKSLADMRNIENASDIMIYPGHGGPAKLQRALDNVLYY